ncbi:hypothetical protein [Haloferax sp. DFSO60]|uniref:hypothetical protein n=1 Tax=Haloferax sp. DFSO60 TaxID=3388652 RepID=UPI00397A1CDD
MSDGTEDRVFEIEVTYQDSGFTLNFPMDQWWDRVEKEFASFDAIKKFYRTDVDELAKNMSENGREIDPDEPREGPAIVVSNPPKEWKEDFGRAAPIIRLAEEQMVQMGLFTLVESEVEAQNKLADAGQFKPLIIRQSAFFEAYLEFQSQLAFQDLKEEPLSNNEMSLIEGMGHTDRIRLAHLFDVIDEVEHGYLQSMASLRNKLAHSPWGELNSNEEANVKATAESVLGILESKIEEAYESVEVGEIESGSDGFDIGFGGLDTDTQLLQLSILDVIDSKGGQISLSKLETILLRDPERVRQRCLRMDHIGYLDLNKDQEVVSIRKKGRELLREENYDDTGESDAESDLK